MVASVGGEAVHGGVVEVDAVVVNVVVASSAEQDAIVGVGGAAVFPPDEVVDFTCVGRSSAVNASLVSGDECPTELGWCGAVGAAGPEDVARGVEEEAGDLGVAEQSVEDAGRQHVPRAEVGHDRAR